MSWARRFSRKGCSATSASSSGIELAGSPEGEVGLEAVLQRRQTKLVQARDLGRDSVLMEDVLERLAPPEAERLSEQLGRSGGIVLERMIARSA